MDLRVAGTEDARTFLKRGKIAWLFGKIREVYSKAFLQVHIDTHQSNHSLLPKTTYNANMKYNQLAKKQSVLKTKKSLEGKGYKTQVAKTSSEALKIIKKLIPAEASVINGASVTLDAIGYIDLLKSGKHKWNNIHKAILDEKNSAKQLKLRKESSFADYYLGSVHALTESGDFFIASNSGSQLPSIAFNSPNLIFVVSTKKIVPDFDGAMKRLKEYVIPLENTRALKEYHVETALNKLLIFMGENPMIGRTVTFILVEKDLGY